MTKIIDHTSTRPVSASPGVFDLRDPRKTPQQWFQEASTVPGSVVLLPPKTITLEGPIDVKNIAKVTGWNPTLSHIIHLGDGPLFSGIYNYAHHKIYPEFSDFSVEHFSNDIATFLELGSQQHIVINRLKIEGYPGGKWLRFVNTDPVQVEGLGFGTWTENIRISNVFAYGHPAVGVEFRNESADGKQSSFINTWVDMHLSLDGPESIGLLFDRAHVTAGQFLAKFNLHAPGTCVRVQNYSMLRNNHYAMLVEDKGTRLSLDATSTMHGYGTFIKDDLDCQDVIEGKLEWGDSADPFLRDGYQVPKEDK